MVQPSNNIWGEAVIKVLMDRDRVVFRPVGQLDRESVEALQDLLACARDAGLVAVVDLDAIDPDDLVGSEVPGHLVTAHR